MLGRIVLIIHKKAYGYVKKCIEEMKPLYETIIRDIILN